MLCVCRPWAPPAASDWFSTNRQQRIGLLQAVLMSSPCILYARSAGKLKTSARQQKYSRWYLLICPSHSWCVAYRACLIDFCLSNKSPHGPNCSMRVWGKAKCFYFSACSLHKGPSLALLFLWSRSPRVHSRACLIRTRWISSSMNKSTSSPRVGGTLSGENPYSQTAWCCKRLVLTNASWWIMFLFLLWSRLQEVSRVYPDEWKTIIML